MASRKSSSSEGQRIPANQNRYKTYYNRFREWHFPVDTIKRNYKIAQLYALVSGSTQSKGSQSRDTAPSLHFNEGLNSQVCSSARPDSITRMATEHATSECQRSTILSPASQILTTKAIDEEQSDFAWYSTHDLGETFQQTRTRFKELFRKSLSDKTIHLTRIKASTSLKRRKIACETKSRLVDTEPHRASKYP